MRFTQLMNDSDLEVFFEYLSIDAPADLQRAVDVDVDSDATRSASPLRKRNRDNWSAEDTIGLRTSFSDRPHKSPRSPPPGPRHPLWAAPRRPIAPIVIAQNRRPVAAHGALQ